MHGVTITRSQCEPATPQLLTGGACCSNGFPQFVHARIELRRSIGWQRSYGSQIEDAQ
jgi:hypothetical protein